MEHEFDTVEQAIKELKLDRRRKYFEWSGDLVFNAWYTSPCSGCSCDCSDGYGCSHGNAGCSECGYTGKRRGAYPQPIFHPNGSIVKIKSVKELK